jgi:hypothetical protein
MDTVMKYTFAPLSGFWDRFMKVTEIMGYSRAAAHLASMGLHEEAKNCMMQIKELKNNH